MDKFYHSVRLDEALCKGCINCIKRCPTEAIRVRGGKASINNKFCIDCGECIRVCPHHAKHATYDKLDVMRQYEYTVALPAPSLYSQFNNLDDVNIVLNALIRMGFDDVFEVGAAAELVSEATRQYISEHEDQLPLISTACPSVVRLIRVRFPNLIPHLLPLNPPVEVAAVLAARRAMEQTGLPREQIGIMFISPCPVSYTHLHGRKPAEVPLQSSGRRVRGLHCGRPAASVWSRAGNRCSCRACLRHDVRSFLGGGRVLGSAVRGVPGGRGGGGYSLLLQRIECAQPGGPHGDRSIVGQQRTLDSRMAHLRGHGGHEPGGDPGDTRALRRGTVNKTARTGFYPCPRCFLGLQKLD